MNYGLYNLPDPKEWNEDGLSDKMRLSIHIAIMMLYTVSLFIIVVVCMLLCSCKTKYIPVPDYHNVYVTKTDSFIQKDSVFCHDSIFVHAKGDTIWYEKFQIVYRDRWREKLMRDTFMRSDTIQVPCPIEVRVPAELSGWQWFQIWAGRLALLSISLACLVVIAYLYIKFRFGFKI